MTSIQSCICWQWMSDSKLPEPPNLISIGRVRSARDGVISFSWRWEIPPVNLWGVCEGLPSDVRRTWDGELSCLGRRFTSDCGAQQCLLSYKKWARFWEGEPEEHLKSSHWDAPPCLFDVFVCVCVCVFWSCIVIMCVCVCLRMAMV